MFLNLAHTNMEVYKQSFTLVLECYRMTKELPESEKFNLISQIRKAATSVRLNIAEGCSRKSEVERKRFYEVARGSVIEIDAALDLVVGLDYMSQIKLSKLGKEIISAFKLLSGLINDKKSTHH